MDELVFFALSVMVGSFIGSRIPPSKSAQAGTSHDNRVVAELLNRASLKSNKIISSTKQRIDKKTRAYSGSRIAVPRNHHC
jgi:hypothetical protein